ncbi:MAG: flagellar hook-length control protein FliK [Janthinobacterium lividum]
MVTSTGVTGLRPVTPLDPTHAVVPVADGREDSLARLAQIATGREYTALVLAKLNDGQFLVKVADAEVRMVLPAGVKAGDDVKLIKVPDQSRPTFLLASTETGTGAVRTALSNTGRLIDTLLQSAQRQGVSDRVVGQTPLVAKPDSSGASATEIAHALKESLGSSGLFYESHVSEWASGARSLESLMREPQAAFARPNAVADAQARLAQNAASASTAANAGDTEGQTEAGQARAATQSGQLAPASTTTAYGPSGLPLPGTSMPLAAPGQAAAATSATQLAAGTQTDNLLQASVTSDPDAARLVSLQLGVMEQNRAAWQGELWAGQRLQWDVSEEVGEDGRSGRSDPEQQTWKSNVRFELPSLGAVSATLHLQGNQVRIQLRAADPGTVELLQQRGSSLASALDVAGSRLDQLTVRQDNEA